MARDFPADRSTDPGEQIVYARIGIWYPLRVSMWILGDTWWALLPTPFLATFITLISVWALTSRCIGPTAGLIATAALGLTPYTIISATIALPDVVCGAMMIAGLALAAPVFTGCTGVRFALARCLLAGFLFGVGYSAKEYSVLMLPGLGLYLLLLNRRNLRLWMHFGVVCVGALTWLGVECLIMWRMVGEPLFHPQVISSSQRAWGNPAGEMTLKHLYWYWTGIPRWLINPDSHFGWWGPIYVAGLVLAFVRRTPAAMLAAVCLIFQGLYQCIGTVDLFSYWPMWHQPRYLVPLFPLGAVLIGHVGAWLWGHRVCGADFLRSTGDYPTAVGRPGLLAARRIVLIALAAFFVHQSILLTNRACRNWGAASIFFSARDLLTQTDPPWLADARMTASGQTRMRMDILAREAGFGDVELIDPAPQSAEEWQRRFGGRYVWVSRADRIPLFKDYKGLLNQLSRVALSQFELVASTAPPTDRLNRVFATVGLADSRLDTDDTVDVYYVPVAVAVSGGDAATGPHRQDAGATPQGWLP